MHFFRGFSARDVVRACSDLSDRLGTRRRARVLLLALMTLGLSEAWSAPPSSQAPPTLTDDPLLTTLIEQALSSLPEVSQREAELSAQQQQVSQAAALPDPTLTLGVQNDGFTSWQIGMMETSWYSVMLSQTFPWPGKRGLRARIAELSTTRAEAAVSRARLSTEADVRRAS